MSKCHWQAKSEAEKADKLALHSLRSALSFLEEAFASVRHYTALNYIGDALKAARHAENALSE